MFGSFRWTYETIQWRICLDWGLAKWKLLENQRNSYQTSFQIFKSFQLSQHSIFLILPDKLQENVQNRKENPANHTVSGTWYYHGCTRLTLQTRHGSGVSINSFSKRGTGDHSVDKELKYSCDVPKTSEFQPYGGDGRPWENIAPLNGLSGIQSPPINYSFN